MSKAFSERVKKLREEMYAQKEKTHSTSYQELVNSEEPFAAFTFSSPALIRDLRVDFDSLSSYATFVIARIVSGKRVTEIKERPTRGTTYFESFEVTTGDKLTLRLADGGITAQGVATTLTEYR